MPTLLAEVFGTPILGGLCAYPVAILLMGQSAGEVAFMPTSSPFWCPPPAEQFCRHFAVHLAAGRRFKEYAGTACPIKEVAILLSTCLANLREKSLVHSITNFVTVNDCANLLLACGARSIMASDPQEAAEITAAAVR